MSEELIGDEDREASLNPNEWKRVRDEGELPSDPQKNKKPPIKDGFLFALEFLQVRASTCILSTPNVESDGDNAPPSEP